MTRTVYRTENGVGGAFNPAAGQNVRRAHKERTFRQLFRLDGSVAATEEREVLTLDTDGEAYGLVEGRRRRLAAELQSTALGRIWYIVRGFGLALFDCLSILVGCVLAYALASAFTTDPLWHWGAVAAFLAYCAWLRTHV
jgi:hypothetical protein